MKQAVALTLSTLLAAPALAAIAPPPRPAQPQPYVPPQAIEEDRSCLDIVVEHSRPDAEILLRNTCALRVNFALCVRRSDDAQGAISRGSLSPSAVYGEPVRFTPQTKTFTHQATFCSGVTCKVAAPDC